MKKQNLFFVISMIFVIFLLTSGCGGSLTTPPIEEDFINIISVYPESGLQDGVDTNFRVEVEYNLFTLNTGIIYLSLFPHINSETGLIVEVVDINKSNGIYEFDFTIKPKYWGRDLSLCVYINDIEHTFPPLDHECRLLTFSE